MPAFHLAITSATIVASARTRTGTTTRSASPCRELDHAGLLLDFRELKNVMRPVIDYLDHQMINDLKPFDVINPSAENLAKYFFDETNKQLREMTNGRVTVKDVLLYETDTTTARYYE
jgi:6-pyruvoyltetrahydropterin/6-carboxytetrahydropterin synthase